MKHFQLALIDEASQILEPDLLGILSARHQQHNAIDKFVLVGDYKQLPAIAQQSAEEAAVTDPLLRQIGLEDCRNSLFERLYKSSPDTCRSVLRRKDACIRPLPSSPTRPSTTGNNWSVCRYLTNWKKCPTKLD